MSSAQRLPSLMIEPRSNISKVGKPMLALSPQTLILYYIPSEFKTTRDHNNKENHI